MESRIDVIIPALNEELAISNVIGALPRALVREIVVCDNGSTDSTAHCAREAGATVVQAQERGYGSACMAGIEYLSQKDENERPDVVVFIDGDYSDYPEQLPELVDPIFSRGVDLVIGSRAIGQSEKGAMQPIQVFGNWLATTLMSGLYGRAFTDLGPFRAIRWNRLLDLQMQDRNYGWTVEMQIKASKMRLKCAEVPVNYRKRIGKSKVSGTFSGSVLAGYKILSTILKYAIR